MSQLNIHIFGLHKTWIELSPIFTTSHEITSVYITLDFELKLNYFIKNLALQKRKVNPYKSKINIK